RPVSQQFTFDKSKSQDTMLAVILKQVNKPYRYQILYILADGSQFTTDWKEQNSSTLYINSPFITRSYTLFAQGGFTTGIDTILLKLKYVDAVNKIEQDTSYSFTAQNRSHDWPVSTVINSKGKVTYSGVISYKNHTTEDIPETTTDKDLIEFGPPNQVIVTVAADPTLLD